MDYKQDSNVFIGTHLGSFKGLKLEIEDGSLKGICKNVDDIDSLKSSGQMTAIAWGDEDQEEVLMGFSDRTVKLYDTDYGAYSCSINTDFGKGKICGIGRCNGYIVVAVESGHVKLHKEDDQKYLEVKGPVDKVKLNSQTGVLAAGGKGNLLQLWDLAEETCVFKAKNVRNDSLELEVPSWVSDVDFIRNSSKVVTCSRYGHVRVYDPSSRWRRPVLNFCVPDRGPCPRSLTACSVAKTGDHIVVGAGDGYMGAIDIRGKGLFSHRYKGAIGSIRAIVCHPTEPYVFSGGLDRHLRVHNFETRELLYKEFLKSKLTCLLVRDDFFHNSSKAKQQVIEDSDVETINLSEEEKPETFEEKAYNELFDQMEAISEEPKFKKKKKIKELGKEEQDIIVENPEKRIEKKYNGIEIKHNGIEMRHNGLQKKQKVAQKKDDVAHMEDEVEQKKQKVAQEEDKVVQKKGRGVLKKQEVAQKEEEMVHKKDKVVLRKWKVAQKEDEVVQKKNEMVLRKQKEPQKEGVVQKKDKLVLKKQKVVQKEDEEEPEGQALLPLKLKRKVSDKWKQKTITPQKQKVR